MSYERLSWDSSFFGIPIGRVHQGLSDPDQLALAAEQADADGISCLYLLLPVDDQRGLHAALSAGFRPYDLRVELDCRLDGDVSADINGLRPARSDDIPALERIARETFRETRFFNDARFPRSRACDLYARWVRRGVETFPQRQTFVVDPQAGFVTCGFDTGAGTGIIELMCVPENASRQGTGAALVQAANAAFVESGLARSTVVTQGRNVAAQRLYQQAGYRTRQLTIWLHRWSS